MLYQVVGGEMKQHPIQDGLWKHNYNRKIFANSFDEFINWKKRREGEGGFLAKTLRSFGAQKILDTAAGTGCDAIYLKKEGFDVTANEFDPAFYKRAKQNMKREKTHMQLVSSEWSNLTSVFEEGSFDAVLCLGNSLTYLPEKSGQIGAVKSFFHLLKNGMFLLIDERNYPFMLSHKEEILGKKFCGSGNYVYCGTETENHPILIEENRIVFEYVHNNKWRSHLTVYPFKKGEMLEILRAAGFSYFCEYSDYKEGYNENADFFQYVAVKK